MKKWVKVILGFLAILLIAGIFLYIRYLKADYVVEPTLSRKLMEVNLKHQEKERTFLWYAPANLQTNALLFVLHGSTGTGEGVREQTAYEFDKLADQEGFVVVYPTGYFNHWNDCRGTADYEANTENMDDISYLKAIENYLSQELNRTFAHRFATGHSNGGHFCLKLAFEVPEWIDGIAPISANIPIAKSLDCQKKGQFVPILLINGTDDPVNPYDGGLVSILGNDSRGTVLSTDETMKYWTDLTDCQPLNPIKLADINANDASTIEKTSWNCGGKTKAVLLKINGGGHTIPDLNSRMPAILGTSNQDINSAQEIWDFFKIQIQIQ